MTILDSNIWIAFLHTEDTQHERAQSLLQQLPTPIYIPEYIIAEVCTVLSQRANIQKAHHFIDGITTRNDIQILYSSSALLHAGLALFRKQSNSQLSFIDIILLALSKQYDVLTFDQDLTRAIKHHAQ